MFWNKRRCCICNKYSYKNELEYDYYYGNRGVRPHKYYHRKCLEDVICNPKDYDIDTVNMILFMERRFYIQNELETTRRDEQTELLKIAQARMHKKKERLTDEG